MATAAPLLGGKGKAAHSKASIFYGADEYLDELRKYSLAIGMTITITIGGILICGTDAYLQELNK